MGNRAFIKFQGQDTGVYLHWNGGRDSIEPMLEYCRLRGFRFDDYGVARFCQVVGNWFGGELSIGVQSTRGRINRDLDPGDNGVYIVKDWQIIDRYEAPTFEQHEYDPVKFMIDLDNQQPEHDRLGELYIREYAFPERKEEKNG